MSGLESAREAVKEAERKKKEAIQNMQKKRSELEKTGLSLSDISINDDMINFTTIAKTAYDIYNKANKVLEAEEAAVAAARVTAE